MPTSGRPRPLTVDEPTRQQLDELDALLQRMLALPVSPPEDAPETARPDAEIISERNGVSSNSPNPDGALSPGSSADETKVQGDVAKIELRAPSDLANPATLPPAPEEMENRPDAPASPSAPSSLDFSELEAPREVKQKPARPAIRPPRRAWPLRPLLWLNSAFESSTAWLGPLGRWLRGPGGRGLLGWGGLLLIAAALAWIALDGMGWTW